jgi:transposase
MEIRRFRLGDKAALFRVYFSAIHEVASRVKSKKNDVADAEAICEAVTRSSMRFVPVKNVEQQAVLSLHRARQGFVIARTAQANQIRSLLGEFGLVIPKGICHVAKQVPRLLEDASNELPGTFRQLIAVFAPQDALAHTLRRHGDFVMGPALFHRAFAVQSAAYSLSGGLRRDRRQATGSAEELPCAGGAVVATHDEPSSLTVATEF